MGIFRVNESYRPNLPPDGGATVLVSMEVVSVTKIDSRDKGVLKYSVMSLCQMKMDYLLTATPLS